MKKILRSVALLFAMSISANAIALDQETTLIDGVIYAIYEGEASVTNNPRELDAVIIRDSIENQGNMIPVTKIEDRAFFNNEMTSVSIPSTVTYIGEKAFYGCKGLTSLEIPSSVTWIGENAFEKCTSMETLSISSSLESIEEGTFYDCYSLLSLTIPPSVKNIKKSAFANCLSMETVTIPESVDSIGGYAFYTCESLKTVTIPSSVKSLGESVFWNCKSLEVASISTNVKGIEMGTFYGCKSLINAIIPSSVTTIGRRAFEQCAQLPVVILPSSVTTICEDAFKNCDNLGLIVSLPTEPPTVEGNAFYRVPSDATVYVPSGTLSDYISSDEWKEFNDIRELGTVNLTISSPHLNLNIGESETLDVTIEKAIDVSIVSEAWVTSNPSVAFVLDGVVTAIGEGNATISFIAIDNTGCPHIISCEVFVEASSGIKDIMSEDNNADFEIEYYNLKGVRVNSDMLIPGIYIKREGNRTTKILVK